VPSSRPLERLVVDANPFWSILARKGALKVVTSQKVSEFAVSEHTLHEVEDFLPHLAQEIGESPDVLRFIINFLPLTRYPRKFYQDKIPQAKKLIAHRDPDDVDTLALALKLDCPIWSNDSDFDEAGMTRYTTAQLLQELGL
jgi:predicted nucleic acid-binding protein